MTSSRGGSDLLPDPVIHVTALIAVIVLAVVLAVAIPRGGPATDDVAQASPATVPSLAVPSREPTPTTLHSTATPAIESPRPTPTATPTARPTPSPTARPTPSPTPSPTASPSPTPSPTATPSPTPSPTATPTPRPTERPRQVIAFAPLRPMTYGDDPSAVRVTATSGLPVILSASGPCEVADGRVRPTGAGTCVLTARQPGDRVWAPATTTTRELVIERASQSITLGTPSDTAYGAGPVALTARATSGLDVVLRAEGPCAIGEGTQLIVTGAGTCTIVAMQPGNEDWAPAGEVRRSVEIGRASQDILFEPIGPARLGEPAIELTASATSGLPVSFDADGPCIAAEDHIRAIGAGTCTLTARQPGDDDWAPAPPVTRALVIDRAHQAITFEAPGTATFGERPLPLEASATSGLPVAIRATGPCSIADGRLSLEGAGTCRLTARQAGNDDWAPAEAVSQALVIMPARQVVAFDPPARTVHGAEPIALDADADSGLPVTFDVDGPCVLVDGRVRPTGAGTCTLTARQAGNDDWAPADDVVRDLVIERASQSIHLEPLEPSVFGAAPIGLTATASSGLPVSFSTEGPCVLVDGQVRPTGAGTCTVTARQPGDDDWTPAMPVSRDLVIERAPQTIAFPPLEPTVLGSEPLELEATAASGLPVTFSARGPCSIIRDQVRPSAAGVCTLTASQPGNEDWAPASPAVRELIVERASQSIDFGPVRDLVFGAGPQALSASSSSGLRVSIDADGPCDIDEAGELVLTGAGTCVLTASQGGDARWAPAMPIVREVTIEPAAQRIDFAPLPGSVVGASPLPLSANATSGLPVSFSTEGPCRLDGGGVRPTGAGICAVTARQPGDRDHAPAPDVRQVFRIERIAQQITFPEFEARLPGGPAVELSAEASSGLPVTYRATGPCSIDAAGGLVLTGPGTCTVTALQPGDPDHAPAADVTRSLEIIEPSSQPTIGPTGAPEPSLAERPWPLVCSSWRQLTATESAVEGAIEGAVCLDDRPGILSYELYRFPDVVSLGTRFTEQVTGAQPPLGVSDEACRPRSPGARAWQHGWLACWIPEGSTFARLHWTDERTNTYGMLEATHDGLQRIYRQWEQAYLPGAATPADSPQDVTSAQMTWATRLPTDWSPTWPSTVQSLPEKLADERMSGAVSPNATVRNPPLTATSPASQSAVAVKNSDPSGVTTSLSAR